MSAEQLSGQVAAMFATVSDPPCVRFDCKYRVRCAEELLACTAFRFYVETGRAHLPQLLFPERITRRQQPRLKTRPRLSSKVFQSLLRDDADVDVGVDELSDASTKTDVRREKAIASAISGSPRRVASVFDIGGE